MSLHQRGPCHTWHCHHPRDTLQSSARATQRGVLFGLFLFGGLEFPQILVPLGGLASFGALGKYELLLDLFPGVRVRVLHLSECCHENWIVA